MTGRYDDLIAALEGVEEDAGLDVDAGSDADAADAADADFADVIGATEDTKRRAAPVAETPELGIDDYEGANEPRDGGEDALSPARIDEERRKVVEECWARSKERQALCESIWPSEEMRKKDPRRAARMLQALSVAAFNWEEDERERKALNRIDTAAPKPGPLRVKLMEAARNSRPTDAERQGRPARDAAAFRRWTGQEPRRSFEKPAAKVEVDEWWA